MKKVIVSLIFALITAVSLGITVSAAEFSVPPHNESIKNYDEAFKAIYDAAISCAETVDLSEYNIRCDDLSELYSDVLDYSPELFYLDGSITYYHDANNYVKSIIFQYEMTGNKRAAAVMQYEKEIAYIVSLVDDELSDAEKALWIHDYLISSYEYDTDLKNYDAYSLLTQRKGVCQAYALVYVALMRELGIDCIMVTSQAMNHGWNLVKIDGEWYHVDLVFDDPTPDRLGRVMHENFLLNDEEIAQTPQPHHSWTSPVESRSEKFSDAIWTGVNSRMVNIDGLWYYIDESEGKLVSSTLYGRLKNEVYSFDKKWYVNNLSGRYWVGVFSGVAEYQGQIFVNTSKEIIAITPSTKESSVFLECEEGDAIYGCSVYKDTLEYYLADSPTGEVYSSIEWIDITGIDPTEDAVLPFTDVSRNDSYYDAVKYVYSKGLFRGVSEDRFAPESTLTRAMFVTVLGRLCSVNTEEYTSKVFDDVELGTWYSPYVEWAAEMGIVNGVGDNRFSPMGEITREQMYKIIAKCGDMLLPDETLYDTDIMFVDKGDISDWAIPGVKYCVQNGLIGNAKEGNMYLLPKNRATRAEAAQIFANFSKMLTRKSAEF
ncbi:MAG: hypothetical protein E7672_03310 [Ruminococcaceae bacterium]|nr:hypothetical protein [Oscillospiraceae bacterium]